ncbi:MAG: hypothetical protein ACR2IE_07595 [Candidatus Sumerlaeaceae bacterium]
MTEDHGREMRQILGPVARRVNWTVWLSRAVAPAAGVLAGFAVVLLLLKMLAPQYMWWSALVFLALPVLLATVFQRCRKGDLFFRESEIAEVVDHVTASDGVVTSVYERPALAQQPDYYTRLQQKLREHFPRLNSRYFAQRLVPAAAFVAVVLMIPPRPAAGEREKQEVLTALTQPLTEKLQMNAEVLPEKDKQELQKQLEEIKQSPEGVSREQWEAVEEIQQRIENAVQQSETAAGQTASALNQLAGLLGESKGDSTPLGDDAQKKEKMEQIVQDLTLRANDPKMPLSSAQRKEMKDAMSKCKGGKCSAKDLAKLRKELAGMCEKMGMKEGDGNCYGRGGRDRGRADAPLVMGDEQKLEDAEFEEKDLNNQFVTPEDMVDLGIIPIEPKPEPGKFSPGTLKNFSAQEGSNVNRTKISPSQKDVVSRYFGK